METAVTRGGVKGVGGIGHSRGDREFVSRRQRWRPIRLQIRMQSRLRPRTGEPPDQPATLFGGLFEAHHDEIHRYVASRLSRAHADDLAAETFLVAFRSRDRFSGPVEHRRAWLFGIATNLIHRHRRDEERRYRALGRAGGMAPVDDGDPDGTDRVVDRVVAGGIQPALAEALGALNPADRDALLLVAVADLSYAEVGAALGIPPGTVGSRLTRARKAVRAALSLQERGITSSHQGDH
jgi:RNA polymerase sigma-70 factor (ECF subfamily)